MRLVSLLAWRVPLDRHVSITRRGTRKVRVENQSIAAAPRLKSLVLNGLLEDDELRELLAPKATESRIRNPATFANWWAAELSGAVFHGTAP